MRAAQNRASASGSGSTARARVGRRRPRQSGRVGGVDGARRGAGCGTAAVLDVDDRAGLRGDLQAELSGPRPRRRTSRRSPLRLRRSARATRSRRAARRVPRHRERARGRAGAADPSRVGSLAARPPNGGATLRRALERVLGQPAAAAFVAGVGGRCRRTALDVVEGCRSRGCSDDVDPAVLLLGRLPRARRSAARSRRRPSRDVRGAVDAVVDEVEQHARSRARGEVPVVPKRPASRAGPRGPRP